MSEIEQFGKRISEQLLKLRDSQVAINDDLVVVDFHALCDVLTYAPDFIEEALSRSQSERVSRLEEALKEMLEMYGPPKIVAELCYYPARHPITLARSALNQGADDGR